ncbi:MAG: hypothetical protein AB1756_01755 [Acidobacteriota bacterium]
MKKILTLAMVPILAVSLFNAASYLVAKETLTKTGWITDTMCKGKGDHAKCALQCVTQHGAKFAFYDNETSVTFEIDKQDKAKEFAGQEVMLKGVFDAEKKIVELESIKKAEKK